MDLRHELHRSIRCASFCVLALGFAMPARAQHAAALQDARLGLARYELGSGASDAVHAISQLSDLLRGGGLSAVEHAESRFLRAAAASDLLILARLRGAPALGPALEAALGVAPGSAAAHLDAELAACTRPPYGELAAQVRASLALASEAPPWSWTRLSAMRGSQRDLLLLHQIAAMSGTAQDATAALSAYAADPCAASAECPAPYSHFDAPGRRAVAALAEAGSALSRLHAASAAGDPLAAAAIIELATFTTTLPAIELRPALRPEHAAAWLDAAGQPIEPAPQLLLRIGEDRAHYVLAPRVRLDADGLVELVSPDEPDIAAAGELPVRASLAAFIAPAPELVDFLRRVLATDAARSIAVAVDVGVPARTLGRTLVSLQRAGWDRAVLIDRAHAPRSGAQPVRIALASATDSAASAELALRVRLGGYSLRARDRDAALDIPRIRGEEGLRFDTATLATELAGRSYAVSQLSFMADVASDQVTSAALELGKSSRSLELLLP